MDGMFAGTGTGILTALTVAAAAALLLAWAWHGRKAQEHRSCRRCGFGLSGGILDRNLPCPECGADLSRLRAVRVGQRQGRRPMIVVALLVLSLSCAWLVITTSAALRGVTWIAHRPLSWVISDTVSPDARTRDAALAELVRRVRDGRLSAASEQALVEQALAYQADLKRSWSPGWGEVVETARAQGRVTNEQWRRYLVQAITFILEPQNPSIDRASPSGLALTFARGPDRLSDHPGFSYPVSVSIVPEVNVSGYPLGRVLFAAYDSNASRAPPPVLRNEISNNMFIVPDPTVFGRGTRIAVSNGIDLTARPELTGLSAGPQTASLTAIVRLLRIEEGSFRGPRRHALDGPERRVTVATRWELRSGTDRPGEQPLDALVGPEWKGVWVPPSHREAVMRGAAKRKESQPQRAGQ